MSKMKRLLIDMMESHLPDDEEIYEEGVLLDDVKFIPYNGKLYPENYQEADYEWY